MRKLTSMMMQMAELFSCQRHGKELRNAHVRLYPTTFS